MKTLNESTGSAVATALVVAVLLAGCERFPGSTPSTGTGAAPAPAESAAGAPAPPVTVGTRIDDTGITARVKSAMVADPDVKSLAINVETRKGEVMLSGFVASESQIERAVDLARRTDGVVAVQNKLAVGTPGTVGNAVDDTVISARVRTALVRDDALKALDVSISTNKGTVQLSGFVENEAQIRRVTEIARSVEGVAEVDNRMSPKK